MTVDQQSEKIFQTQASPQINKEEVVDEAIIELKPIKIIEQISPTFNTQIDTL